MIETTNEICKHCGNSYQDTHVSPRALYLPYYCEKCMEELNKICDGSFIAAVYQSRKMMENIEEI